MTEKRSHPRAAIDFAVRCERKDGSSFDGHARDLSVGGMFVESPHIPAFGTDVTIVATLPGPIGTLKLPGVVRWSKPGGFGVQFGLLGARETFAITRLTKH